MLTPKLCLDRGWRTARLPFGAFDSAETLAVVDGVLGDTVAGFSMRVYRIGCSPPAPIAGNLLRNGDFEELTISGAVAWWGLFWQNDFRDPRVKLVADTEHALSGRYSARLILPCASPGWPSACRASPGPIPRDAGRAGVARRLPQLLFLLEVFLGLYLE